MISYFKIYENYKNMWTLQEEGKRVSEASQLCQSILHMEALRTNTQEAGNTDKLYQQLLNK